MDYPSGLSDDRSKNTQQRSYQKHLDVLKSRHEMNKNPQNNRKHNSPDYNKYRTQDPQKNTVTRSAKPRDDEKEQKTNPRR